MSTRAGKRVRAAPKSVRTSAIHEAAHAVAAVLVSQGIKRVTIVPHGNSFGHVIPRKPPRKLYEAVESGTPTPAQRAMVEGYVVYILAGPEAARRYRGRSDHIGASDDRKAVDAWMSPLEANDDVRAAWLRYLKLRAKVFVDRHWPEINAVADALIMRWTLSEDDVLEAIRAVSARAVRTPVRPPR